MKLIRCEILPNGRSVKLIESYPVDTYICSFMIPIGFITDFASVPRLFWHILPPWGKYSPAAVAHDYLYYCGKWPKFTADLLFLELMRQLGVAKWKQFIMYQAVKWFGWPAWNQHRERERERDQL